ncbi:MAG: hypothetical protein ABFS35_06295 [Bacteroidota bacterium]
MDKEVKKLLQRYVQSIDEEVYLNFIKLFSKRHVKYIKKADMSVYLKCKQFDKKNEQ